MISLFEADLLQDRSYKVLGACTQAVDLHSRHYMITVTRPLVHRFLITALPEGHFLAGISSTMLSMGIYNSPVEPRCCIYRPFVSFWDNLLGPLFLCNIQILSYVVRVPVHFCVFSYTLLMIIANMSPIKSDHVYELEPHAPDSNTVSLMYQLYDILLKSPRLDSEYRPMISPVKSSSKYTRCPWPQTFPVST
jgi:hypothetical protein